MISCFVSPEWIHWWITVGIFFTLLFITTGCLSGVTLWKEKKTDHSLYLYTFYTMSDHFISVLIATRVQSLCTLLLTVATPAWHVLSDLWLLIREVHHTVNTWSLHMWLNGSTTQTNKFLCGNVAVWSLLKGLKLSYCSLILYVSAHFVLEMTPNGIITQMVPLP